MIFKQIFIYPNKKQDECYGFPDLKEGDIYISNVYPNIEWEVYQTYSLYWFKHHTKETVKEKYYFLKCLT